MKKRIILILVLIGLAIAATTVIYQRMSSDKVSSITLEQNSALSTVEVSVPFEKSIDYMKTYADGTYVLFFGDGQSETNYIKENLLPEVNENISVGMIYVDMTTASSMGSTRFKQAWQFETYPAFAIIRVESGEITIVNVLADSDKVPIDLAALRTFFYDNDVWQGTY